MSEPSLLHLFLVCLYATVVLVVTVYYLSSENTVCGVHTASSPEVDVARRPRTKVSELTKKDVFQRVSNKSFLRVYSAYFDLLRTPGVVTIVGIRSTKFSAKNVICRFSDNENNPRKQKHHYKDTHGNVTDLPETMGRLYRPVYILCALTKVMSRPEQVSLIYEEDPVSNLLQITYPYKGPFRYQFSMCVSPVYGGYNIWRQTLESMEMARMLGVDHVNIYVEKAGGNLIRVLQYYVDQGFMSVLPWNDIPSEIHAHGQVGCMHDCLLRMRYVTKYVVFIDLDELIILRTKNTLREMVDHVLQRTEDADKVGAFLIKNFFFHRKPNKKFNVTHSFLKANLTSQLFERARSYGLKTVLVQFRGMVWEPPHRCRTIADPLKVETMAVHHPDTMFGSFKEIAVDPDVGLLHHYRLWWYRENTTRDTFTHKFTPFLVQRLEVIYKQLDLLGSPETKRTSGRRKLHPLTRNERQPRIP